MARSHGVLKVSVWEPGNDFRALTLDAQWAYMMLISQPQISNLGVLPYTPEKWARVSAGLTLTRVDLAVAELEQHRYVIVDVDAAELLIRTFVKHDKVWSQWQLVPNARKLMRELESEPIRVYLTQRHPWLVEDWTVGCVSTDRRERLQFEMHAIKAFELDSQHETSLAAPKKTPVGRGLNTPLPAAEKTPPDTPLSEGEKTPVERGVGRLAYAKGAGEGEGSTSSSRSRTSSSNVDLDAAPPENEEDPGESAAAAGGAPTLTEQHIAQALATLPNIQTGTLDRVHHEADGLDQATFDQTIATVHDRQAKNPVGLLVKLLREAQRDRRLTTTSSTSEDDTPSERDQALELLAADPEAWTRTHGIHLPDVAYDFILTERITDPDERHRLTDLRADLQRGQATA